MRSIAKAITTVNTTMTYDSMMSQGVAIIHIVAGDGMTPVEGRQLFAQWDTPEPSTQNMFSQNTFLTVLASTTETNATEPPYAYYMSADLGGVMNYSNGDVSTSASGVVVIIGPPPLLYTSNGNTYETAYTVSTDWGTMAVFGGQPGSVVDVFLPDE